MGLKSKDFVWLLVPLLYVLLIVFVTLVFIYLNFSICEGQYNATTLLIALASLFGLAVYAFLTWKIAKATELNTEINRTNFSDISLAFSFRPDTIYSDRGRLLTFAEILQDIWHGPWQLVLYIHNTSRVSGVFRLNFRFGVLRSPFKDLGLNVFKEEIFYEPDERGYIIQANESLGVTASIDKEVFEKWVDACYPEVAKETSLSHKILAIIGQGPPRHNKRRDMYMYVEMALAAYSNEAQKKNPFRFKKYFYIRFNEHNPGTWDLIGAPVYAVF
jgi:hypothetical protein